jgi:PAS domain-containing protein
MKLVELVRTLPADPTSFALLDSIPIGVFILAADGRQLYTNLAAKELLGRDIKPGTTAEERAAFFHVHVAGTGAPYPSDHLPSMRALRGEHVRVMDMELRTPGRMIIVDCAAAPIEGPDGKIVGSVTTFSDVTDFAHMERAYQILLNNVPVGFYSVKPDGDFLVANPALRKILGYASEEELRKGNLENDHVKRQEHLVFRHRL